MALSDLITRPIATPLEGFDKAVESGFKIAQQQQELSMAQERLKLQQDQIKQEYLTKGISTLSTLSKVKNQKQRKILSDMLMQYMSKGGIPFRQDTVNALLSDEETSMGWSDALKAGEKEYPTDPVLAWARAAELANMDPELAIDQTQKLRQAQLAAGSKETLESFKAQAEKSKLYRTQLGELSKKRRPAPITARAAQLPLEQQVGYLQAYDISVGNRVEQLRAESLKGIPEGQKKPEKLRNFFKNLRDAEMLYSTDPQKSEDALNKAEETFGELKAAYKPTAAKVEKPKEALDLLASAQKILDKALTQEQRTRADQLNQIISTANDPQMRKNPFAGQGALSALGRVNDPKSSIREEEYKRIARESGTALEGVRASFERAISGNALTENQWKDLNRVANFYQQRIKKDLDKKIAAVKPRLLKSGITEEEIYSAVQPFEPATYGVTVEKQELKASQKGKPNSALINKAKEKFPNDWKQRLQKIGYDTGGL